MSSWQWLLQVTGLGGSIPRYTKRFVLQLDCCILPSFSKKNWKTSCQKRLWWGQTHKCLGQQQPQPQRHRKSLLKIPRPAWCPLNRITCQSKDRFQDLGCSQVGCRMSWLRSPVIWNDIRNIIPNNQCSGFYVEIFQNRSLKEVEKWIF